MDATTNGTLKISNAAAALNQAEMGIKAQADTNIALQSILPISADQFYVDEDAKYNPGTKGEAAAITSAKVAA